jgi:undecaprenyl-diphosphatase
VNVVQTLDESILLWLNHLGEGSPLRPVLIRVAATGFPFVIIALVAVVILFRGGGGRMLLRACLSGLIAFSIGKLVAQLVMRPRPFELIPEKVIHEALIVRPGSFPSIHAVFFWALVGALLFSRCRAWGWLAAAFAVAMMAGRAAAGVHWPSDLLTGAAIGLASAWAIAVLAGEYRPRREVEAEQETEEESEEAENL